MGILGSIQSFASLMLLPVQAHQAVQAELKKDTE